MSIRNIHRIGYKRKATKLSLIVWEVLRKESLISNSKNISKQNSYFANITKISILCSIKINPRYAMKKLAFYCKAL